MARITWNGGAGTHIVVISGYESTEQRVRLTDPGQGCSSAYYFHSNLISSNGTTIQSGTGRYTDTFIHT